LYRDLHPRHSRLMDILASGASRNRPHEGWWMIKYANTREIEAREREKGTSARWDYGYDNGMREGRDESSGK